MQKNTRSHSEDYLSLFIQLHMPSQSCYLWNVELCLCLEPKSNIIVTHVFLVFVINNKPCHILLKYKVSKCYLTIFYFTRHLYLIGVWFGEDQNTNTIKTHVQ